MKSGFRNMGLRELLIPQDKIFFEMFERQAATVREAAYQLVGLSEDFTNVKEKRHAIELLEHQGDQITHGIYEQLNRTFITPLDPEEISRLASALDDVMDNIDSSAEKMYYYGIDSTDSHMIELAKLIHLSTVEIEGAVKGIRSIKDPRYIEERCIEVNRLENLADDVLAHAVTDLFKTTDAVGIIKYKDIYENLETATDYCEDVANVLSDIAIRHS
jgi:Phosphate transport regulator (distant homolog of PhoU)